MTRLHRSDTPLAQWLAKAMAAWIDPETGLFGISQRRLAEETGASQAQIHEILKRGHAPGPDILIRLADFFAVGSLDLFRLAYLQEKEREVCPATDTTGQEDELLKELQHLPCGPVRDAVFAAVGLLLKGARDVGMVQGEKEKRDV